MLCCLFLWLIAFPCYLVARSKYKALPAAGAWQGYGPPVAQSDPWQLPVQQAPQWSAPAVRSPVVPAAAVVAAPVAPPQYSPDGHWWWNGQEWVPVQR